jgi:TIR domain
MRLFISHASEDKKDFVEPLVTSLEKIYEVWFDKRELAVGDSLFGKISEGLSSCDFGVVVLSPHYAKKWPKAELGGLFALETTTKKVILPIWKDIGEEEVKASYPILADRFALRASDGVEKVVEGIRFAVDASARQRQLTGLESALERFKGLDETLTELRESKLLLDKEEGVTLVVQAADVLFATLAATLSATVVAVGAGGTLKFTSTRHDAVTFLVDGPFGLTLHLSIRSLARNSAARARLTVLVFRQTDRFFQQEPNVITTQEFSPTFRRQKQVVWKGSSGNQTLSTEELAGHALDVFRVEIERLGLKE